MPTVRFHRAALRRAMITRAVLAASLLASGAHAACTLSVSPGNVDFGVRSAAAALPPSAVAGWRLMGQRTGTLTGVCDAPRTEVRLRLANVQAASPPGLLRLPARPASAAGALRLRAQDARAGSAAVLLSLEGSSAPPAASLDLPEASVLVLHLPQPLPAGTAFTVQLHMAGLLPQGFTPAQQTTFQLSPSLELLP
ncbi:MAG: hypothetical protein KA795_15060 [Burkholderiaceae bacterium]|nr:hypothetical protein [Burkholderiaceae bacterium]